MTPEEKLSFARETGEWVVIPAKQMDKMSAQIVMTTAPELPKVQDYEILGVVTSQSIAGINAVKEIGVKITDVLGGRSRITEGVLYESKHQCLKELQHEALKIAADAVIAVKLDTNDISGGSTYMTMVSAYGTAIRINGSTK